MSSPFRRSRHARRRQGAGIGAGFPGARSKLVARTPHLTLRRSLLEKLESRSLLSVNLGSADPSGSIAGAVWTDTNQDGVRQPTEPGIGGVAVTLKSGAAIVASTITDPLGLYSFQGVADAANYVVQITAPLSYTYSIENAGTDLTLSSNVSPTTGASGTISVTPGQTSIVNAGLQPGLANAGLGLAFGIPTIGFTEGSSIVADSQGDIYVGGNFDGTSKFPAGNGATVTLKTTYAPNDFVAKYSAGGTLLWVRQVVSDFWQYAPKISLDSAGDVYVSGWFTGDSTFGATKLKTSTTSVFLWKLDSQGSTQWAESVMPVTESDIGGMAVDPAGNAYVVGTFSGTGTIPTSPTPTTLTSAGQQDIFVAKYDSTGAPIWAESFGAAGDDGADSVAIDPAGDPVITGSIEKTVALGSTTLVSASPFYNDYVAKLHASDGTVAWADLLTSTTTSGEDPIGGINPVNRIAVDAQGNVYSTGRFTGTMQLDPTNGSDTFPNGANATFISKLDNNGKFEWGKAFNIANGGYDVEGYGIALDSSGDVFTTGEFAETINFNPGSGASQRLTALGASYDIYISELDTNGNYLSALQFGGTGEDQGTAISVDALGNVYDTGISQGPANFSPPPGTYNVGAANEQDIFVLKLNAASSGVAVNAAPSFIVAPKVTAQENAGPQNLPGFMTNVVAGPPGETDEVLTAQVATDNPGLFAVAPAIDPLTGTLSFTPGNDQFGTANVTVTLHNNGGTAKGGADTSAPKTFSITVNYVNQPPTFTAGANQTINENSGPQTVSAWATNIDPGAPAEAGQTLNFEVSTDNDSLFSAPPAVDPSTGDLTFTPAFDANGLAHVTVKLHDDGGGTDTSAAQTFTITVNYVNQAPTFTAGGDQVAAENDGAQSIAGWATQIGAGAPNEAGQSLSFLVSTDNAGLFAAAPAIDPATGTLTFTPAANVNGVAHVTVELHDDGGTANGGVDTSAATSFTITVSPINQPPTFTAGADQTVGENAGGQTVLGWATNISPGAADEASQTLGFELSTDNDVLFATPPAIDATTGNLTYTPAADTFGVAHVTVKLHDDGGTDFGGSDTSQTQTFTVNVLFVNQAPFFIAGANQTLDENAGAQTVPGWAKSISAGPANEAGQALDFQVTTDNDALFAVAPAVDPATGNLTYTPAANVSGQALVTVTLHDNGGTANGGNDTSVSRTFTIAVNFVNQAPAFTAGGDQTIDENTGAHSVATWAGGINAGAPSEAAQTLTFEVSTDNDALFAVLPAVDPLTGTLTYTPAVNATGAAHVSLRLHDDGGIANGGSDTSAAQTFTIVINLVNHAPSFIPGLNQVLLENAGPQIAAGWATRISPGLSNEAGQALDFELSTNDDSLFSALPAIDPTTGNLTYTMADDANGVAYVTARLHDNGGTANGGSDTSAPVLFTITTTPVNQQPSFTAGADTTVNENSGVQTIAGWATDINPGAPNEMGQALTFDVSVDNDTLFAALPEIDPATGNLMFTPATNATGSSHVTIALHDSGGTANGGSDTSASQTFTITVRAVNQAPSFTAGMDQTVNENSGAQSVTGWATNLSAGPPSEASQALNFEITTDNDALFSALPAIDPMTGDLTYTPNVSAAGTAHVTVHLHDDGGTANGGNDTSAAQTFAITVDPVNQAPSFTDGGDQTVNEDLGQQTVTRWATNISPGPANEAGQQLSFVVSTDNDALFKTPPVIDPATGDLTYTPAAGAVGVAHVNVRLHDSGGTARGGVDTSSAETFAITVNLVNQAPSFTAGADQTANESSGPQLVKGWATGMSAGPANEANQTVSFIVSTDDDALFSSLPILNPTTGDLTYTPAADAIGAAHVTVRLHDNGGTANGGTDTSAPQTFTITLRAVNQAPSFAAGGDQTVNENVGPQTVVAWATEISAGPPSEAGQSLAFQINTDNDALFSSPPAIDPLTGDLSFTPAAGATGTAHVTVKLHDDGGTVNGGADTSAGQTFAITVNLVNHAPSFTAGPDQTVNEDAGPQSVAGWATALSTGPANEAGQTLAFTVSTDNDPLFATLPAIDPLTGELTYTTATSAVGVAHVSVVLHDNGGTAHGGADTSASQSFTVAVNLVNEPPSFRKGPNVTVDDNAGGQAIADWASQIRAGDQPAETAQTVSFAVTNDNAGLFAVQPTLDPSGKLTFTPLTTAAGQATVSVVMHDNGGTANGGVDTSATQSFTITVDAKSGDKNSQYLIAASENVLGRPLDPAGLAYWTRQLDQSTPRSTVIGSIDHSDEYFASIIEPAYLRYLDRAADATGLQYWTAQMRQGLTDERLEGGFIGSAEFFQKAGGTDQGWVDALYQSLLGRAADTSGEAYWVSQLAGGAERADVAFGFSGSLEREQQRIEDDYFQYLGRAADQQGVDYWINQFANGSTNEQLITGFVASDEYYREKTQ